MDIKRAIHILAMMTMFILTTIPASGMPYHDDYIPPDLTQWKNWVLHGQEEQFCPIPYNDPNSHQCAWPSRLRLELDQKGGRFTQEWLLFIKAWVPLPGGTENWPWKVHVDGKAVPVVGKTGIPEVYLKPGKHSVEGEFTWKHVPEMINVPAASGLVTLSINGHAVDFPLWDRKGRLWLQKREVKQTQEDRLEVRIYRLLRDNIPLQVTNKIDINVSGQAREIKLEGLLLERAVPMRIKSPLPVRFGPEGELMMQARPGRWEIRIETRLQGPVSKLGPVQAKFGQEVWSFQSRNHLRMVKLDGVKSVDPMQTNIPSDWKRFPAFNIKPGSEITFKEIRRGDPEPAPDQLHLKRIWWLDFNGRGFTIRDKVTGIMSRQWYLAMNPPNLLGHVMVDGVDQLITKQGMAKEKKPGIELRKGKLNLVADSRLEASPRLIPAVGWDHDFQSVSAVLNLPPGWRLLTAGGVDVIP
ncbi:MAG: hypothetical protein SV375_06130, partial [Thermodesulfobacteriota bacterium]|nr:hypothetical protein [Thermodesulfobacteriota bacterium]